MEGQEIPCWQRVSSGRRTRDDCSGLFRAFPFGVDFMSVDGTLSGRYGNVGAVVVVFAGYDHILISILISTVWSQYVNWG